MSRIKLSFPEHLEVISHLPTEPSHYPPLLFIHGAFCGAWIWEEHFLPWFAQEGFEAHALSLRGHGKSQGYENLAGLRLLDYVEDTLSVLHSLAKPPILIGHSMGGMVAQRVLASFDPREFTLHPAITGCILVASVPPGGLWGTSLHLLTHDPALLAQIATLQNAGMAALSPKSMHRAMFSLSEPFEDTRRYLEKLQAESLVIQLDMTVTLPPISTNGHSIPMLVLGAEHDRFVPAWMTHITARHYDAESHILDDGGHAMMLGKTWQNCARLIRDWLTRHWP